jgi:hypothetical protein
MPTTDASAFKDQPRNDGSGKTDILFNGPGDGSQHGHVVQHLDPQGNPVYDFVRDVEGNVYIDNK